MAGEIAPGIALRPKTENPQRERLLGLQLKFPRLMHLQFQPLNGLITVCKKFGTYVRLVEL